MQVLTLVRVKTQKAGGNKENPTSGCENEAKESNQEMMKKMMTKMRTLANQLI